MPPTSVNPRLLAIAAAAEVLDECTRLTECAALKSETPSPDHSMARHFAFGLLRWLTALEWLAGQLLARPLKPRDRDIYRLILLGIYQLWQDETPPHAALHATAECARLAGKPWAVGLINAVLRRFQREQGPLIRRLEEHDEQFAHPAWLLAAIRLDWPSHWQAIVAANNRPPPLWLRLNRREVTAEDLVERLEDQGFETARHPFAAEAIRLEPAVPVQTLTGFAEGWLSVQDPAAQLTADLLDLRPGLRVLDACAAPGGKTCHMLERCPGLAVTAVEIHAARLERVRENLERLRLDARLIIGDATRTASWWDGQAFDRILLDAPCSASGVIRRHPDIRHLRTAAQVTEATRLQAELLRQLWPLLDPGGILVYATCSVFRAENREQVQAFLQSHGDAIELPIESGWGHVESPGRQILPGEDEMDGFFHAVLRKTA